MYTLYSIPGSCSTGITVLLEQLGVEYQTLTRDEVPNYADIVPTNQVPALKTDNGVIAEGAAIVLYLLEKHGEDLMPKDIEARGEFYQWLMFNYATLHPAYAKVFAAKSLPADDETRIQNTQEMANRVATTWKIIEERLENRRYIVGEEPTIIDFLATIYTSWAHYFPEVKIELSDNVRRLAAEISELEIFKKAYASENTTFKKSND